MRIILFGGAFDPVHYGHMNMAERAADFFDANVIFIPARVAVWKNESISPEHKINMLKLAISESKYASRFSISTYEIDKNPNEYAYSIDTVRHFKEKYPNDEIFLLIGEDQANSFHLWKESEELAKQAQIVYFGRLNEENSGENQRKYHMIHLPGKINDISSSDIRTLKSLETPDSVLNYIIDNELYFMDRITVPGNQKRHEHVIRVAKLAYEIAKANNFKYAKKALIAALLHDIAKDNRPEAFERDKTIIEAEYKDYIDISPVVWHQVLGVKKAKEIFKITDKTVLKAIEFHTTGNKRMSDVAKIVYAADKIEPGRGYDSSEYINAMKCSITDGFVTVLKANVEFFKDKKIDYQNKFTKSCLKYYLK